MESLTPQDLRDLYCTERKRNEIFEKDLTKKIAELRKVEAMYKALQEQNTSNARNRNNTSSAFSLPSEFKTLWDHLTSELIIDAYLNIGHYEEIVPLVSELFLGIREEIMEKQDSILRDIG